MAASEPRLLFVAGCQRSGTTAFAEYLNEHPKILVGVERYKGIPARKITPELFRFKRLLDYKEETVRPKEYYVELLSKKTREELEWVGDKNPNYLLHFDVLSENNPGAHFIVLYRPVEDVAESWEVASQAPGDPWRGRENGFERGVENWNRALGKTREFAESVSDSRVLIVAYRDFFYRGAACASLISRFLDLEFDENIRERWREISTSFERNRRPKKPLTEGQAEFIERHKDHAAEEWTLGRIEEQWKTLEREAVEVEEMVRSSEREPHRLAVTAVRARAVAEEEAARARRLDQRVAELEENLAKGIRKCERLEKQNEELTLRLEDLREQLRRIKGSRSWRLLGSLNRLRTRVFARGGRTQ